MKFTLISLLLLFTSLGAFAQGEYFVDHDAKARALSKRLQANAHNSPKRFDGATDVSQLTAWLIGSCQTAAGDYHLVAYFSPERAKPEIPLSRLAYVGVFHSDEQLHDLWRFGCDARQFYADDTKLMFAARPRSKADTSQAWARVPRQTVLDFAAANKASEIKFHGQTYMLSR